MGNIVKIFIVIIFYMLLIYIIKNNKRIIEKIEFLKTKKYFKILYKIILLFFCIVFIVYFTFEMKEIIKNIEYAIDTKNTNNLFDEFDKRILEEKNFYNFYMSKNYTQNFNKPYILKGFKHVEGEWNTGFVIEDDLKNQFVWVPISNIEKENVVKLKKKDFIVGANILKEGCFDDNYENFIKSSLENGGFYISRYEVGIDHETLVSKANKKLLTGINKKEVENKIEKMYVNTDFNCELVNGYAYDSTIEWLTNNNNIEVFNIDTNKEVLTGRNSTKNIYDIFDNIFEFTRRV